LSNVAFDKDSNLVAINQIQEFSPVITIPIDLIITLEIACNWFDSLELEEKNVSLRVEDKFALFLANERKNKDGKWYHFLNACELLDVPLLFDVEELNELNGTPAYDDILDMMESIQGDWEDIKVSFEGTEFSKKFPLEWRDYIWARSLINCKAMKLAFFPSPFPFGYLSTSFDKMGKIFVISTIRSQNPGDLLCGYLTDDCHRLLVDYGLVYENNKIGCVPMELQLTEDKTFKSRFKIMKKIDLGLDHYVDGKKMPKKLLQLLRIINLSNEKVPMALKGEINKIPTSKEEEDAVLSMLEDILNDILEKYPTKLEQDLEILRGEGLSNRKYKCIYYRKSLKEIIMKSIDQVRLLKDYLEQIQL
jgi:hypothetical protein